jgi:hypothetical protein
MRLKSPFIWKTTQYAILAHFGVSSQTWNQAMPVSPCSDSCSITRRFTKPRAPTAGNHQRPVARNDTIGAVPSRCAGEQTALALHLAGFWARQLLCQRGVV